MLHSSVAIFIITLVLTIFTKQTHGTFTATNGSTLHLKEIVLGRCYYYKQFKLPASRASSINCTAIWDALYAGFAYRDPCTLMFSDYEAYFDAVGGGEIANKSLFWSGTYKAVHSYSDFDLRFTTLEDTMAGWLMNGLTWCGNPTLPRNTTDGIDYKSCPKLDDQCDCITAFWGLASRKFAESARGIIRVMVNGSRVGHDGSRVPAYNRQSFFGKYELPTLNIANITELRIIVVHTIDASVSPIESCGNGSIKLLQEDAQKRGLTVKCFDDPSGVKHMLCADHPAARECLFANELHPLRPTQPARHHCGPWMPVGITFVALTSVLLVTTVFLVLLAVRLNRRIPCNLPYSDMVAPVSKS